MLAEVKWDASLDRLVSAVLSGALFIAVVVIVFLVAVVAVIYAVKHLEMKVDEALEKLEQQVQKYGDTAIPAFATFVGAVGISVAGWQLPPVWSALVGCAVAFSTLLFSFVARSPDLARYVGIAGALIPYVGLAIAWVLSDSFGSLTPDEQALLVFTGLFGFVGVACFLAKRLGGVSPQDEIGTPPEI